MGLVFHDVISLRHAEKAIEAGVDGLILVANGAGGHAGTLNPFALVTEVRKMYSGPVVLQAQLLMGLKFLFAQVMGADFVYMGTKFICSAECPAPEDYKDMIIRSSANDIIYKFFYWYSRKLLERKCGQSRVQFKQIIFWRVLN